MTDTQTKNEATAAAQQPVDETAIVARDLEALANIKVAGELDLLTAAKAFAKSGMFKDVKSQSQAVVKILMGQELGISPVASMTQIHWMQIGGESRLEPHYQLRAALIKRSGTHDYRVREGTWEKCRIEWFELEPDGKTWASVGFSEFTLANAETMGLKARGKWKEDPESMLFAAALRRGQRKYAPHLTIGKLPEVDNEPAVLARLAETELRNSDVVEAELVAEVDDEGGNADARVAKKAEPRASDTEPGAGDDGPVTERAQAPDGEHPTPSSSGNSAEDAPSSPDPKAEDGVWVWNLFVPPADGGPFEAATTKNRHTAKQIEVAQNLVGQLSLKPEALDAVCKARYGLAIEDATFDQVENLCDFLEKAEPKKVGSRTDEEPPEELFS